MVNYVIDFILNIQNIITFSFMVQKKIMIHVKPSFLTDIIMNLKMMVKNKLKNFYFLEKIDHRTFYEQKVKLSALGNIDIIMTFM